MKIALDAMGGDKAPAAVVEGAVHASQASEITVDELILVGKADSLNSLLASQAYSRPMHVIDCPDYLRMDEPGSHAIKGKRQCSITRAIELLKEGEVQAVVTAGNSAGAVASAIHLLGCFPGIKRPALACVMPTVSTSVVVLDVGANLEPQPYHLAQAGILGEIYAQEAVNIELPQVGLLNVGVESNKGTRFIRRTFKLLSKAVQNFYGNVEGDDLFRGRVDVAVCDGFVGNVILKACESWGETLWHLWEQQVEQVFGTSAEFECFKNTLNQAYRLIDYTQAGGAPLLGVKGTVVIAHGRSTGKAIANAIRLADDMIHRGIVANLQERFQEDEVSKRLARVSPGVMFLRWRR